MKKIALTIMAAVALIAAASCQKEVAGNAGESVNVVFTTELADVQTRAIADGTTVNKLRFEVYEDGNEIAALRQTVNVAAKKATVNTTLAKGKTYTFAFFAYKDGQTYYELSDAACLKALKVNYAEGTIANKEDRDAFCASKELTVTSSFTETITLKRPFAQVNVVITDAAEQLTAAGVETKATVSIKGYSTEYNVLTGEAKAVESTALEYTADASNAEAITIAGTAYTAAQYLSMAYVLVPAGKSLADIEVKVNNETYKIPNAPVQANYRTNIILSLLTTGKFNIVVDPAIAGDYMPIADGIALNEAGEYIISNGNGLSYASANLFKKGGVFKLAEDIDMTGVEYLSVKHPKVKFDGCDHTISNLTNIKTEDGYTCSALFARVDMTDYDFEVKNLTIANSTFEVEKVVDGESATGAIIGWLEIHGGAGYKHIISNCKVTGCTFSPNKYMGGLVGYATSGIDLDGCIVEKCNFTSAYTEDNGLNYKGHCGGLVGLYTGGTISNCGISECTFDVKGPRGGLLIGTAQDPSKVGEGNWVKGNTGLTNFVGAVDNRKDKTTDVEVR